MNAVPRSGSFLAQEPSTQRPKPSSIVPVAKSSSDGSGGQTEVHLHGHGPGTAPDHVYEASMAWWRYSIRRYLVTNLHFESRWIAEMQVSSFCRPSRSPPRVARFRLSLIDFLYLCSCDPSMDPRVYLAHGETKLCLLGSRRYLETRANALVRCLLCIYLVPGYVLPFMIAFLRPCQPLSFHTGTHTFFMTLLPALYFFGYPETGRA